MEQPISPYRPTVTRRPAQRVVTVRPTGAAVRQEFRRLTRRLEVFIVENPAVSLGMALTVGVVLGWLIKRR